jgi:hypothetical protein
MPVYTFENNKTNEEFDLTLSYEEMLKFIVDNPHVNQVFRMNIVDPVGAGITKPPSDFSKYVLGKVKATAPGVNKAAIEKRWQIPKEI